MQPPSLRRAVLLCFAMSIAAPTSASFAQRRLIAYGFEDYTGDVETTPAYPFTASAETYWNDHLLSTEVVSDCNGLGAHSGTYYLHQNFFTEEVDPCLGTMPSSVNDHGNLGLNGRYPMTPFGDDTDFSAEIDTDTLVVRFYLRTQGDWAAVRPRNKCKFTRTYGTGSGGDNGSLITYYTPEDNRLQIYDPSILSNGEGVVLDSLLYDGEWHAFAIRVHINAHDGSTGNITASVWWDDYEMTSPPVLTRTVTSDGWGDRFLYFDFWQNWSASYPSGSMGIDLDDIEVWDGMPTGSGSDRDAGTASDAGAPPDAGTGSDAGPGAIDAGAPLDAGADAGRPDAGATTGDDSSGGCSCSTLPPVGSLAAWGAIVALGLSRRRR